MENGKIANYVRNKMERVARQKSQDMCLTFLTNREIPRKPGSFRGISLQ